jgi:hypothetical protein
MRGDTSSGPSLDVTISPSTAASSPTKRTHSNSSGMQQTHSAGIGRCLQEQHETKGGFWHARVRSPGPGHVVRRSFPKVGPAACPTNARSSRGRNLERSADPPRGQRPRMNLSSKFREEHNWKRCVVRQLEAHATFSRMSSTMTSNEVRRLKERASIKIHQCRDHFTAASLQDVLVYSSKGPRRTSRSGSGRSTVEREGSHSTGRPRSRSPPHTLPNGCITVSSGGVAMVVGVFPSRPRAPGVAHAARSPQVRVAAIAHRHHRLTSFVDGRSEILDALSRCRRREHDDVVRQFGDAAVREYFERVERWKTDKQRRLGRFSTSPVTIPFVEQRVDPVPCISLPCSDFPRILKSPWPDDVESNVRRRWVRQVVPQYDPVPMDTPECPSSGRSSTPQPHPLLRRHRTCKDDAQAEDLSTAPASCGSSSGFEPAKLLVVDAQTSCKIPAHIQHICARVRAEEWKSRQGTECRRAQASDDRAKASDRPPHRVDEAWCELEQQFNGVLRKVPTARWVRTTE